MKPVKYTSEPILPTHVTVESASIHIEAVTVNSLPERIIENFINCGYFLGLTDDLEKLARADPVQWLRGHPYLFAWYPQFFVDASGKVKPTKETVDAMQKKVSK
jgi:hypothetical protein